MNILKILGIVAGIHVVAFFLMFVNPGCRSTSLPPAPASGDPAPAGGDAAPVAAAPAAATPADSGSGAAPEAAPPATVRFSPTRPGTPAAEALATTPPNDVTPATTYAVASGDSLSRIAKRHNTTVAELTRVNHLTSNSILKIGQKLIIPGKAPAGASAAGGGAEAAVPGGSYTVQSGDTLAAIAGRVGSTTAELKRINKLRSDYVQVGQELKLPAASAPAAADAARNPPAATPAAPASVKTPEGALTHEVKPGETIGAIARKYHVRTQDLLVANNIADPKKIRPGQNLVIPGGAVSGAASPAVAPTLEAPAGPAPTVAGADTSVPAANAPDLDSGLKAQSDVPVIKVEDSSEAKTP